MLLRRLLNLTCIAGLATAVLSACQPSPAAQAAPPVPAPVEIITAPATPRPTAAAALPAPLRVYVSPGLPAALEDAARNLDSMSLTDSAAEADLIVTQLPGDHPAGEIAAAYWLYALVAPFPTIPDYVSSRDLRQAWQGKESVQFPKSPLLVSPETREIFTQMWGRPDENRVKILQAEELQAEAWKNQPSWAIIPFEEINPRWKVLSVDGLNPLDRSMDTQAYPLTAVFGFSGSEEMITQIRENPSSSASLPAGNRDPEKMTVLAMTGTTALARTTAERMETMGLQYPGEKIRPWLLGADLTHISNEIPFSVDCPPAVPVRTDWNFCSDPSYIELLDYIGADIIELTGNHVMDWGAGDLLYTLDLYRQNNLQTFGGGLDLSSARQALLVEDHGNKLAFLGCNQPGPDYAWATDETPGSAPCDRDWMAAEVRRLTAQGYLVIVTFQHIEVYDYLPVPPQRGDFQAMAEAGAVIVSGSQSHFPQGMALIGDAFLHYGLGNLFFDQMDEPVQGTRREFIDRHVFYNGRYLNTQLLTAMLEDHAQPRPMTPDERKALLRDAFNASTW